MRHLLLTPVFLSSLLAQDPQAIDRHGDELLREGKIAEAIAEFDRAIQLVPAWEPQHWRRGIAYYYAERYEDGRKQFELHQTVNPSDVENAVWHYLCIARSKSAKEARKRMIKIRHDDRPAMMEVDAMFRGTGSPAAVLAAAGSNADALMYAHLYIGLYYEAEGNATKSLEHMELAAVKYAADHYMGDIAKLHYKLRRK